MTSNRIHAIHKLLKGIETGDPAAVAVVNQEKYIQHNPQTQEGGEGLAALFARLARTNPRVNLVRVFEDGDFVFAQTEYFFDSARVGFEVFRFENGLAVEHWDNIQLRQGPNESGHSMVDGPSEVCDHALTEENRALVAAFAETILQARRLEQIGTFVTESGYIEHSPLSSDGLVALKAILARGENDPAFEYQRVHSLLAQGNYVLSVAEGAMNGEHTSFYDLFRVHQGLIVEHWGTIETVPPRSEWKNQNGKF